MTPLTTDDAGPDPGRSTSSVASELHDAPSPTDTAPREGDVTHGGRREMFSDLLESATILVRERMRRVAAEHPTNGVPSCPLEGQLLRPLVAFGMAPATVVDDPDHPIWRAMLAVQMAHEASLLHDDIIDQAATRRGVPTRVAERGVAAALVQGDHLLSGGYCMAAETGSLTFAGTFARSVERTIAGEIAQGHHRGRRLTVEEYLEVAEGKSGELIGCALSSYECLREGPHVEAIYRVGRRIGRLYQMLDDLLDYCPSTDTGKPPLQDYSQGRWTWVLAKGPLIEFGLAPLEVARRLHVRPVDDVQTASPMRRCLRAFHLEAKALVREIDLLRGDRAPVLEALIDSWVTRASEAIGREEDARDERQGRSAACREVILRHLPSVGGEAAHLAGNSRSFSFASRLLPARERERIARVYAFCRVTDDLVDGLAGRTRNAGDVEASHLMDEWQALASAAYLGEATGVPVIDRVMHDAAEAGVPFRHVAELIEGMRMDIRGQRYRTLDELRVYTHRVASVVGLWITELVGVRDPFALERAASLGHAMQLTNILRDVGEDLRAGRLYLPQDLLSKHLLTEEDLRAFLAGTPIDARYRALIEELMEAAEVEYARAFAALPCLPPGFQEAFATAAGVYRGIHEEIRRNGYDNLNLRAHTSTARKAVLAARSFRELGRARVMRKRLSATA